MKYFSFFKKKERTDNIERLKKSEKRLQEFQKSEDKIMQYEILQKAIFRIYDVINESGIHYDRQEELNGEVQLAELFLIPYLNHFESIDYKNYRHANKLVQPAGEYTVVNHALGLYSQYGVEKISEWIAINFSLEAIASRWLAEIPRIENLILESQKKDE